MIQSSFDLLAVSFCFGIMIGAATYVLGVRHGVKAATPKPIEPLPPDTQDALKAQNLIVAEWHKWNPWYCDPILALEAQIVHLQLQGTNPGQPLAENLAEVTAEMRRRYPEIMTIN